MPVIVDILRRPLAEAPGEQVDRLVPRPEQLEVRLEHAAVGLRRPTPGIIGCPHGPRIAAPENERSGPLRVRCREENAHGNALLEPDDRGSLRACGIHDRPQVVHPRLERRNAVHRVGHPGAPLVEDDETRERRQPAAEVAVPRRLPTELHVRDITGHEDDVERTVARDLVGDVDVAAPGVPRLRNVHLTEVSATRPAPASRLPGRQAAPALGETTVTTQGSFRNTGPVGCHTLRAWWTARECARAPSLSPRKASSFAMRRQNASEDCWRSSTAGRRTPSMSM